MKRALMMGGRGQRFLLAASAPGPRTAQRGSSSPSCRRAACSSCCATAPSYCSGAASTIRSSSSSAGRTNPHRKAAAAPLNRNARRMSTSAELASSCIRLEESTTTTIQTEGEGNQSNSNPSAHRQASIPQKEVSKIITNESVSSSTASEEEQIRKQTTNQTANDQARISRQEDELLWWETGRQLLSSPIFAQFLRQEQAGDPSNNIAVLRDPVQTLQRLCRERPGTKETSELVHRFLQQISDLLCIQRQKKGRTHFDTAPKSSNNHSQASSSLLASAVQQCIYEIVQRQYWKPDTTAAFQTLIQLSLHEPHCAEQWLDWQWQTSRRHRAHVQAPTRNEYQAVVQAWARGSRTTPAAAERAARLLRQMQRHYASGKEPTLKPTEAAYTGWIVAITSSSNVKNADSASRAAAVAAEQVLEEIWERRAVDHFVPGTPVYNAVLHAWARARDPEAAEAVLRRQCKRAQMTQDEEYGCLPDATSFTAVIAAWSQAAATNRPEAPERAHELFRLMQKFAAATQWESVQPNVVTYTSLLNCWAKSNHPEAPLRAEAILREMQNHHDQHHVAANHPDDENTIDHNKKATVVVVVRPNVISYNMVMNAWARSGRPEAAERVEEWFRELQRRHQHESSQSNSRCTDWKPDHVTYMTRINAWERSGHLPRTSARKAASVLEEMLQASSSGDSSVYPSTLHFNRVIMAWTQCGDAFQAEALLERMLSNFLKGKQQSAPNISSFNFVLSAWSKKSSREGAAQAEAWLDRMEEYSQSFGLNVKPDVVSFNTVLGGWARSGSQEVAWDRAVALKRRMEAQRLRPDIYTYGSLLQIVARNKKQRSGDVTAATTANQLLSEMQESGIQPNNFILRLMEQCTVPE